MNLNSHLSKPVQTIQYENHELCGAVQGYSATMQGWRKGLEDRVIIMQITPQVIYCAVFDGHGGPEVAEFAKRTFHKELLNQPYFKLKDYPRALTYCFKRIDQMLKSKRGEETIRNIQRQLKISHTPLKDKPLCYGIGSTAHVVLITPQMIYSANIGDSRGVISEKNIATQICEDHKPDNEYEINRITKAGGKVKNGRINGGLNLSRAFGDFQLKQNPKKPYNEQIITSIPQITQIQRTKDQQYLFLASDGLWQHYKHKNQEFVNQFNGLLHKNGKNYQVTFEQLFKQKILGTNIEAKSGLDNISLVVMKLR